MKKIIYLLVILSILANIFLAVKLMQVTSKAQSTFFYHISAISNNSNDIKKQIEQNSLNPSLAYEGLLKYNKELNALMEITEILSVTHSEKIPYGDLIQYSRLVEQLIKSNDYPSEIKYLTILTDDFLKIKRSTDNNNYSTIRAELKVIDDRYKING